MKPETFLLYPMIRILWSLLAICLAANNLSAQGTKEDAKIRFSITRFDPMDRPAPEFMVKNGAKETPVKVPLTYIAGPFSATLRDDKYLDFFEPGAKVPVLSTVVPPELQKDLLLVFIPVKETFEILKIHTPPSSIQGGDHYVIKFGTAAPVVISPKKATLLHDPAAGKSPTLPVIIQQKDGDKWKPVTTENWPHDVRFRTFLFLYTSLRDHHMAFHGITERVD
jgi:hypothetical protein